MIGVLRVPLFVPLVSKTLYLCIVNNYGANYRKRHIGHICNPTIKYQKEKGSVTKMWHCNQTVVSQIDYF